MSKADGSAGSLPVSGNETVHSHRTGVRRIPADSQRYLLFLSFPEENTKTAKYKVYKDGAFGEETPLAANGIINVDLGDGDYIEFTEIPVGATYSVAETTDEDYAASYKKTVNGTTDENATNYTGAIAGDVTAGKDKVELTNNCTKTDDDVKPEGILISNLPYIALALVAIGGLVAYVVVRRRNADEA